MLCARARLSKEEGKGRHFSCLFLPFFFLVVICAIELTLMVFFLLSSFINDRHEELVSEGGVYANMWLHQQKAEDKETDNSNTDSLEEESGLI